MRTKCFYVVCFFFFIFSSVVYGQQRTHSKFYQQRTSLFEELPAKSSDIIFLGNSITNGGEWSELFQDCRVKNRGISADWTLGVYDRLDDVLRGTPAKIFLMIGVNDVGFGMKAPEIVRNINLIVHKIQHDSPKTAVYVQSLLPVNDEFNMFHQQTTRAEEVKAVNELLLKGASNQGYTYINLYPYFANKQGKLDEKYTNDGLHLMGSGYKLWVSLVKRYL